MDIETHSSGENTSRKVTKVKICQFCGKILHISNISRHVKICEPKSLGSDNSWKTFSCDLCGKTFARLDSLKRHTNSCLSTSSKKAKIPCYFHGCSVVFNTRTEVLNHIILKHESSAIQPVQYMEFQNKIDFFNWKENEEQVTCSHFSKKNGTVKNVTYFYCQNGRTAKSHKKRTALDRNNSKGQVKIEKYCISSMKVEVCANVIKVWYYPTHSHEIHMKDIQQQPIQLETSNYTEEQRSMNESPLGTLRKVKHEPRPRFRGNRKKRLVKNLKFLLEQAEADKLSTHVLNMVDTEVDHIVKNTQASTNYPLSIKSKKRRKPTELGVEALMEEVVLHDDLVSHVIILPSEMVELEDGD